MSLTLELKPGIESWIEFGDLPWDELTSQSVESIGKLLVKANRQDVPLRDLFSIEKDDSNDPLSTLEVNQEVGFTPAIVLRGDLKRTFGIGRKMKIANIVIDGDAGNSVGTGMRGGKLLVHGSVGDFAGQGMRGGLLFVGGNAGSSLAGPRTGELLGMRGGDIIVAGSVGNRPAERLRRGTILVCGDSGDDGCAEMIAGTFCCRGTIGMNWCDGMKRGTLIRSAHAHYQGNALLSHSRTQELSFLSILWKYWRNLHIHLANWLKPFFDVSQPIWEGAISGSVERQVGDLRCGGRGEILAVDFSKTTSLATDS